jgi:hypothetical protein
MYLLVISISTLMTKVLIGKLFATDALKNVKEGVISKFTKLLIAKQLVSTVIATLEWNSRSCFAKMTMSWT